MKVKQAKEISLQTITDYLNNNSLLKARSILSDFAGATIKIKGVVEKVAKREDILRLVIKTSANGREMTVFANFDNDEARAKVKTMKIKKGVNISIIGKFQSVGTDAVVLNDCHM